MEIYNVPDKEFKIAVLRKLSELQENRQFNEIKQTIQDQNENFNRDRNHKKKNKTNSGSKE